MRHAIVLVLMVLALPALLPAGAAAQPVDGESQHEGYYYPALTSAEFYRARARVLPQSTRERRIAFITGLTVAQMARPYAPGYVIFAKGEAAQKLLIVSLGDNGFRTLYQARAQLAQLTSTARATPLLRELAVDDLFTFFDVVRMLGFEQVTVSDGASFAHQVTLE
jgi:hypothetical protein